MSDITNMNNEELLIAIRDGISSFVKGEISAEQAQEMLIHLEASCKELEDETDALGYGLERVIAGLFYIHNKENFAKLTLVFRETGEFLVPFIYTGTSQFIPVTEKIIRTNITAIKNEEFGCYNTKDADGLPYRFFTKYIQGNDGEYFLASATSSAYSSQEKFKNIASSVNNYLTDEVNLSTHLLDYFSHVKKYVSNYLRTNILYGKNMKAALFSFDSFKKMFKHTGLVYMNKISNILYLKLKSYYGYDALIVTLGSDMFLVVYPEENVDNLLEEPKKLSFVYEDITLKFVKNDFLLPSMNELTEVWLQIGNMRKV